MLKSFWRLVMVEKSVKLRTVSILEKEWLDLDWMLFLKRGSSGLVKIVLEAIHIRCDSRKFYFRGLILICEDMWRQFVVNGSDQKRFFFIKRVLDIELFLKRSWQWKVFIDWNQQLVPVIFFFCLMQTGVNHSF